MSTTTLTDRVYTALCNDRTADALLKIVHARIEWRDANGSLDGASMDTADWGFVVGLAYGIARGEDPYESGESVVERATLAARDAWNRWSTPGVSHAA